MTQLLEEIGRAVAAEDPGAHYVGGCVRDLLRGDPIKDLDFGVTRGAAALGRLLADRFRGHIFCLHQDEGIYRVVLPEHGGLQIDLCPLRGSLREDLEARDLTINAMALPAGGGLRVGVAPVDPTGGQSDLRDGIVRFVRPEAPVEDPLRTLRALRFRWKLAFALAPETEARIRECVPLLARVSAERIRDELFQLLAAPYPAEAIDECLVVGMGAWLLGPGAPVPAAVPSPSGESIRRVLTAVGEGGPDLQPLLEAEVTPPRRRRELLLFAAALQPHVEAVPAAAAARLLALSGDERQILSRGLGAAGALRELVQRWPARGRMRYRMFRQAGPAGAEAVLLAAAAGGWETPYAELLEEALRRHFWPEPPLLSGFEAMQALGLEPGPRIGRVLAEVEEARADGLLRTAAEAVQWLRERRRD